MGAVVEPGAEKLRKLNNVVLNSTLKRDHNKRKLWPMALTVASIVVFLTVFGYAVYSMAPFGIWWENSENQTRELVKLQRQSTEKRLLRSINFSSNPCTNFYEFVCGNWIQSNTTPNQSLRSSPTVELEYKILKNIESYLNSPNTEYEPKTVHEARKMYKSCLNSLKNRERGASYEKLVSLLDRLRLPVVPSFSKKSKQYSWILPAIMSKKLLNYDFFFQFSIQPDPYITSKNRIYITNPSNKFHAKFDKNFDMNVELKSKFYEFIQTIAIFMYEQNDEKWEISNQLEFRHCFCELIKFASRLEELDLFDNGSYLADYVSSQDLQQMTDSIFTNGNQSSKINWKKFFEEMFEGSSTSLNLNDADRLILVTSKRYICEVLKLLFKTPTEVLEFYMWTRILFEVLPYSGNYLFDQYDEYLNDFFGKRTTSRNTYCADLVHREFHFATSYFITNDAVTKRKINEVRSMFENIRQVFAEEMKNTAWLDNETRKKSLKKLESMKINLGYPHWMDDAVNIDKYYDNIIMNERDLLQNVLNIKAQKFNKMLTLYKKENNHELENPWIGHVLQVNAFYSSFYNSISIPAGLLSYPFFDFGIEAMNYGTLGMIIGHELIHGFDKSGKEFDADGHLNSWWSDQTKLEYERRVNIFSDNYDQFVNNYIETNDLNKIQLYLNRLSTLNENIADHGGLRIALKAYKSYIKSHSSEELFTKLNFTAEQTFFLAFTHSRCEHKSDQMLQLRLTDEHGLNILRVLSTLSSSNEFSEAWKCEVGSPMNPSEEKCRLW